MTNVISYLYQVEESVFSFRGDKYFVFHFDQKPSKQTIKRQIRHRILRRLIGMCNVCLCPTEGMLDFHGLMANNFHRIPWKITKLPSQNLMLGHHRPASETPFKWRFAGVPIIAIF